VTIARGYAARYTVSMQTILTNFSIEFGPVAIFLATYYFSDFFTAIWAAILSSLLAVCVALYRQRRFAWFPVIATGSLVFFGGSALFFQNETFYILQDTIGSAAFALVLLLSVYWWKKPLLEAWFGHTFALTHTGWRTLTIRWGTFFVLFAFANEAVRILAAPEIWVLFKVSSTAGTVLFGLYQFRVSIKERIAHESNWLGLRTRPVVLSAVKVTRNKVPRS